MARNDYPEMLDRLVFDSMVEVLEVVQDVYPESAVLESALRLQFATLTPDQQMTIVSSLGPEWYLKLAARMSRQLRKLS